MNDMKPARSIWLRFSLFHLLTLTAIIAIVVAIKMSFDKKQELLQYRDELAALSSRSYRFSDNQLSRFTLPKVAAPFVSWQVYVPDGQEYELRLGMGEVSEMDGPPGFDAVLIPAGEHRVTLYSGDSRTEEFRYVAYLDGEIVIEKTMGSDWMPNGWSSASGLNFHDIEPLDPAPLELSSRSYRPNYKITGNDHFFGQSDEYVTRQGYRLWIDQKGRELEPVSPFMGFKGFHNFGGTGLRDGIRYQFARSAPYPWNFTRPSLDTTEPICRIHAEFTFDDGTRLTDQTLSFEQWLVRDDVLGLKSLERQPDSTITVQNAYLHVKYRSPSPLQPVVELKWDATRPDEVGLRLADTPANDRIARWRLRLLDGDRHLWRQLTMGNQVIQVDELAELRKGKPVDSTVPLDLPKSEAADVQLQWQTDETLPLTVAKRKQSAYAGMRLYEGLPAQFGLRIPVSLNPICELSIAAEDNTHPGQPFPGGAIFQELQVDLDAKPRDWIWLEVIPK